VIREGDRLYTQQPGQQPIELFAESERVFFVKVFDGQITFETDGKGPATALVLHQNSQDLRATRIIEK
jgi:hypothetical protein